MGLDLYVWGGEYEVDDGDRMQTGLDHVARWPYSGFMRFRERLAVEVGVALHDMTGFTGPGKGRSWSTVPTEALPLVPLLHHSDCDGELTPEECATVAPALREIVARWDEDDWDRLGAEQLADGMDRVAEHGDPWRILFA